MNFGPWLRQTIAEQHWRFHSKNTPDHQYPTEAAVATAVNDEIEHMTMTELIDWVDQYQDWVKEHDGEAHVYED